MLSLKENGPTQTQEDFGNYYTHVNCIYASRCQNNSMSPTIMRFSFSNIIGILGANKNTSKGIEQVHEK